MSEKRKYDSTVARIAGNIASGFASRPDRKMSEMASASEIADWMRSVTVLSVGLARGIVAEIERTEQEAK